MKQAAPTAPRGALPVLFLGVLMGALDIAIVGPALPSIGRDLGAGARLLAWVFTIFVLFNLVGTPLLARLSDLYGRRKLYVLSVVVFGLGSAVAAAAGSMAVLLAGRALQGFAAGGVFPVAAAMIGDAFPAERQGSALGVLGAVFGLAFLLGPVLGGLLLPYGWPWLFWLNVPVAALLVVLSLRVLPADQPRGARAAAGTFDVPGTLLLTVGLTSLALGTSALDAGRLLRSLLSPTVGPLLLASAAALAAFWHVEQRAARPLIDPQVMRKHALRIANLLSAVAGVVEAGLVFVPSLLVTAFGVEPARASFLLLPAVLAMAVGAPVTGRMLDHLGARPVVLAGSLALGLGLLGVRWSTGSLSLLLAVGLVVGLGLSSLIGAPLRYIVLHEAGVEQRAAAQGVTTLFRSVGRMIGGVLLGALIASRGATLAGYHLAFDALGVLVLLGALLARGLPASRPRRGSPAPG